MKLWFPAQDNDWIQIAHADVGDPEQNNPQIVVEDLYGHPVISQLVDPRADTTVSLADNVRIDLRISMSLLGRMTTVGGRNLYTALRAACARFEPILIQDPDAQSYTGDWAYLCVRDGKTPIPRQLVKGLHELNPRDNAPLRIPLWVKQDGPIDADTNTWLGPLHAIVDVDKGPDPGDDQFFVTGDVLGEPGQTSAIWVFGSPANDGEYEVVDGTYDPVLNATVLTVAEVIPNEVIGGYLAAVTTEPGPYLGRNWLLSGLALPTAVFEDADGNRYLTEDATGATLVTTLTGTKWIARSTDRPTN